MLPGVTSREMIEDIYFGDGAKDDFLDANLLEVESNIRTTDESHFQVSLHVALCFVNV